MKNITLKDGGKVSCFDKRDKVHTKQGTGRLIFNNGRNATVLMNGEKVSIKPSDIICRVAWNENLPTILK